jgi:ribose transport system ATP-binding protein
MHSEALGAMASVEEGRRELIAVQGVSKSFGPTVALSNVSLTGRSGSIHAITGENGAGKSTLMKLLAGVFHPDDGELKVGGQAVRLNSPAAARTVGISTVFQELTVLPNLTVAENLLLGREPTKMGLLARSEMLEEAQQVLARIGIDLDPQSPCGSLTIGQQQLVEIAKGVSTDATVFIFDEPTAPLNRAEVSKLESLLKALKAQGKLVFYISHRLDEIFRLCDTVTVLKDGKLVITEAIETLTPDRLITLMVGRPLQALFPSRRSGVPGAFALDVRSLTPLPHGPTASFALRRGEIVGMGGLEGQGQREIVRSLAGAVPPWRSDILRTHRTGETRVFDPCDGVVHIVEQGVGLIPEDRKLEGLYLDLSIQDNMWLGALRGMGLLRTSRRDGALVGGIAKRMQLRARDLAQFVSALSGGNQQKVMIGRWLAAGVDTLLIEQPTRGVDVGAKAEIYGLLREFADQGGAVLALSSDLPELIGLCDRILIVSGGCVMGCVDAEAATEEGLLALALSDVKSKSAERSEAHEVTT